MTEQEKIAIEIFKIMDKSGPTEEDHNYVAYVMFSIVGSGLLKMLGEKGFDQLVAKIKEKTTLVVEKNEYGSTNRH